MDARRVCGAVAPFVLLVVSVSATSDTTELTVQGKASATPWLAADGNRLAVAWGARGAGGATDVYLAVSADLGATFGAPVRVNHSAGEARLGGDLPPRVVFAGGARARELQVLWTARADERTRIVVARSNDGGRTFAPPRMLESAGAPGDRGWPALAAGAAGQPSHAIWLDHRGLADAAAPAKEHQHGASASQPSHDGVAMAQRSGLFYRSLDPGGQERELTRGVCYCCKTALTVASDGAIYAAWRHVYPGNLRDIAFATSRDGGKTFAAPQRVSADGWQLDGCPDDGPALAPGTGGAVHLVWPTLVSQPDAYKAIFYAGARAGKAFGARIRVSPEGDNANHPQIAVSAKNEIAVLWDRIDGGRRRVYVSRSAAGPSPRFAPPVAVSSGTAASYPVAVFAGDDLIIAWTEGDPAASRIVVRRLAAEGE